MNTKTILDALLQKQMDITLKEYKRAEKAEAEVLEQCRLLAKATEQLRLCNVDQANAEAENAAANADRIEAQKLGMQAMDENAVLREWESRCAVALGVPGCHPEEMLHVIDNQREDAERYRWFRSKRLWDADSFPWPKDFDYPEPCLWDDGEMLDAAIDAVRKK